MKTLTDLQKAGICFFVSGVFACISIAFLGRGLLMALADNSAPTEQPEELRITIEPENFQMENDR